LYHPIDVATSAAMLDHLLRGRYMFGFGSGVPAVNNMEQRGMTNDMRHAMVLESLEFIQRAWSATEPFDWNGTHWHGKAITIRPKPYQSPHPPMAVASSHADLVELAGANAWTLMIGQFDSSPAIAARGRDYIAAARRAGRAGDRNLITCALHVHVSESVSAARRDLRTGAAFAIEQWKKLNPDRFRGFLPAGGDVADITYDHAFDSGLFIAGDPETVYRGIEKRFYESGGFGTLLIVLGKDWASPAERDASMTLFMKEVAPRLAALDANSVPDPADVSETAAIDATTSFAAAY
jgi:alkanesulfonate monooxygenase SsuD/methylene tetrahydromethanopterin reductase-like flavin-dependent oxidoreductase (luciferase family)